MLIEGAGVVAHRPTSVPFFIIINSCLCYEKDIHYSLFFNHCNAACSL